MAKFGVVKSELPLAWERALGDSKVRTAMVGRSYLNFMSRRPGVDKQDTRTSSKIITKLGQDLRNLFDKGEIAVAQRLKEQKVCITLSLKLPLSLHVFCNATDSLYDCGVDCGVVGTGQSSCDFSKG